MKDLTRTQMDLKALSEVLCEDSAAPYKALFDEFMRVHEFGLALHSICDYLSSEGSESINPSRISLIEKLHASMQIQDNCLSELNDAYFRIQSTTKG
jgi:hypothetical protein